MILLPVLIHWYPMLPEPVGEWRRHRHNTVFHPAGFSMADIDSEDGLEALYPDPVGERSLWKEIDHVNALYRKFIEASPFLVLASYGKNGIDCSPRGDPPGFVRVVSPKCIQIPDRRGNNRLDTVRDHFS